MLLDDVGEERAPDFLGLVSGQSPDLGQGSAKDGFGVLVGEGEIQPQPIGVTQPLGQVQGEQLLPCRGDEASTFCDWSSSAIIIDTVNYIIFNSYHLFRLGTGGPDWAHAAALGAVLGSL